MSLVDILHVIKSHGLTPPTDVLPEEKKWITVKQITTALLRALIKDFEFQKMTGVFIPKELGWRNRYRIHLLSEDEHGKRVSHRQLYRSTIITELCQNDFLEHRPTKSKWGGQKTEYRLVLDFLPASDFLIESVRMFVEGRDSDHTPNE